MSAAASPLIGLPAQRQHQARHHHYLGSDQQQQQRQPLPSASTTTSKRPSTAATIATTTTTTTTATLAMRRDKPAGGALATSGRGVIRLEVYVDLLCPWCFIEKHSLDALTQRYAESHPDVRFEVTWKPYYIAPTMGKHNVDKRSIYDRLDALNAHFLSRIQVAGAKHDIAFSIRGPTGSTRPAHRLIALALARAGPEAQARVVEMLFQGHFEDGRDLSDEAWLAAVGAAAAGMDEDVVRKGLADDDEAARRVDAVAEAARDVIGVEAVPCVMVQGRYKVGGYQEGHVFESLFDKIRLAGEVF